MANNKHFSIEESLKELGLDLSQMTKEIETRAKQSLQLLALQTHAKIVEKVQAKLKSTRNIYLESLGLTNEGDSLWMITLGKNAEFIEEGIEAGPMFDRILNNGKPAKISKKGDKYKTIPFEHSKKPQDMSLAQIRIANFAKAELKKRGLDKTVMGANGKPATGRVASVDIVGGKAPVSKFNRPLLQGLTIYQTPVGSKGKVRRDVMTFRTISESQKGSGLWEHPGSKGQKFFEEAAKEIEQEWTKIITEIVASVGIDTRGGS
jgi:hypothetical protein